MYYVIKRRLEIAAARLEGSGHGEDGWRRRAQEAWDEIHRALKDLEEDQEA